MTLTTRKFTTGLTIATLLATTTPLAAQETLTMWGRDDVAVFLPDLVEAFNASHETQIDLQIVPSAEMVQKYATAAAGGSAPDLVSIDLIYTPAFAAAGQLEDLTEFAQELPYFDQLSPAHVGVGTYDGKIYGLPLGADASLIIYNKDLYEQAGLDPEAPPTTFAEVAEHAAAVDALGEDIHGFYYAGACPGCNAFTFLPMVWASGGTLFSDDTRTVTLDTPQMRAAVDLYRGMIEDGLVPAGAQTDSGANFLAAFAGGNIGLQYSGAFAIGALKNDYPDLDYGVGFIPGEEGGFSSFAGGDNFVVTAGIEDMAPVREFVDFMYSEEGQTMLAQATGVPVNGAVADAALEGLDERYVTATEAMANGKTPATPIYNDLINSSTSPWSSFIGEVFYTDDVDGTFEYLQDEMQSIIDMSDY
ncbi:ABC transporter substrate-binding protein [Pelagovum pacificum]|uniref:Sugar ABC transporter substrate-binding protein n=1 Tax=Pelagovum pacificum TaxID=2588711 RepID=A0A5C5G8D8_9RHOB|nr:sugar ABC transporter substrate-binding protein [Pelagovum pacificum]QQA41718.1 sugar ABC transporter substrate-binding protein [Pelagovum pacificum]TNY30994.1 sugar ABC transporter substrate-binding protein [Pelagovum pacificum]